MLQETVRRFVDRELIPIEQDSMDGPKLKAEIQESLEEKAQSHRSLAVRCAGRIRWPVALPAGAIDRLDRIGAYHRSPDPQREYLWSDR